MMIDCGSCVVAGDACKDCVVSVLLGQPVDGLGSEEHRVLGVLAESGLVPPLRLVPLDSDQEGDSGGFGASQADTKAS